MKWNEMKWNEMKWNEMKWSTFLHFDTFLDIVGVSIKRGTMVSSVRNQHLIGKWMAGKFPLFFRWRRPRLFYICAPLAVLLFSINPKCIDSWLLLTISYKEMHQILLKLPFIRVRETEDSRVCSVLQNHMAQMAVASVLSGVNYQQIILYLHSLGVHE